MVTYSGYNTDKDSGTYFAELTLVNAGLQSVNLHYLECNIIIVPVKIL